MLNGLLFTAMLVSILFSSLAYGQGQLDVQIPDKTKNQDKDYKIVVAKQIMIVADVVNNQDRQQAFAYIVQIKDQNDVTVSLSWLTGMLSPFQTFSPAQSWIPNLPGKYDVEIFVWSSIDNPDALSPPQKIIIDVAPTGV
jgi:hypothetical protein